MGGGAKKNNQMNILLEEEISRAKADATLAAPPRNCDVGTARQQEKRHKEEVCLKSACPKHEGFVCNACKGCFAMWSQTPYEKGEADGSK